MVTLADPGLRGSGRLTSVFFSPDGEWVAVASYFDRLTVPSGRATYQGQTLHHRVALYRRGQPVPTAWCDDLPLPVNDLAFLPGQPAMVIGSGSYDGGYCFEGDLLVWNWETDWRVRPYAQIPQVRRCRFDTGGQMLALWVCPWTEEDEALGDMSLDDAFQTVFPLELPISQLFEAGAGHVLLDPDSRHTSGEWDWRAPAPPSAKDLAAFVGTEDISGRGPVWDVAWLTDDQLAVVHDGVLLEVLDLKGRTLRTETGEGRASHVLRSDPPLLHVAILDPPAQYFGPSQSRLMRVQPGGLVEIGRFDGDYVFASARDGRVLGRDARVEGNGRREDLLISDLGARIAALDLGHYDCFNHFLLIEDAPHLFFVQGTPPGSYRDKQLCILEPSGAVRRLWPLLTPGDASGDHAMDCCGCYGLDALGEGVVLAGMHHHGSGRMPGFLYRRQLHGTDYIWRHQTESAVSSMAWIAGRGLVAIAFLNGDLWLVDAISGDLAARGGVRLDRLPTMIFSLAARAERLAFGTGDGRVGWLAVDALIKCGPEAGWIDLDTPI